MRAHRKPVLKVLEINLDAGDAESIWFGKGESTIRSAYRDYKFASADATAIVNAQANYESRTIRSEDPGLNLTTLDVGDPVSPQTVTAISSLLKNLARPTVKSPVETEYAERHGEIYISRISPDEKVNAFKTNESTNGLLQEGSLRDQKTLVRLRAERIGTLEGLVFGETASFELPVEQNHVEVDIYAAGLNFKVGAVCIH